jgi:hypothetical protein
MIPAKYQGGTANKIRGKSLNLLWMLTLNQRRDGRLPGFGVGAKQCPKGAVGLSCLPGSSF